MFWFRKKKKKKPVAKDNEFHLINRRAVFGKLLSCWPKLIPRDVKVADRMYVMPSKKEVQKILSDSKVNKYVYQDGILDCDDFALLLHAYVIRKRYEDFQTRKIHKDQLYPLAFGQVWHEDSFFGPHAINLSITWDEGILFIEPQGYRIWKAEQSATVNFVRI